MGVVVVEVCLCLLLAHSVEAVGRDVVYIHQLYSRFPGHLAVPLAIGVVAALYPAARPLVARCERHKDGRGSFFPHVLYEFLQIPAERIHHLIATVAGKLVYMARVSGGGNGAAFLVAVDRAYVVVSELDEDKVAWLKTVVDLVPSAFVEVCAGAASGLGTIDTGDFQGIEHRVGL